MILGKLGRFVRVKRVHNPNPSDLFARQAKMQVIAKFVGELDENKDKRNFRADRLSC